MPNPNDSSVYNENLNELSPSLREQQAQLINDKYGEGDSIYRYAYDHRVDLNDETKDFIYQAYLSDQNAKSAWQRTLEADSTKYQRYVADMKAAGLNPFLLMQGAGSSPSSSDGSVSGGSIASIQNSKRQSSTQLISAIIAAIGAAAFLLLK